MPFGVKPVCNWCKISSSTIWRKGDQGEVLCNSCGLKYLNGGTFPGGPNSSIGKDSGTNGSGTSSASAKNGNTTASNNSGGNGGPVLRKSTRIKPVKKTTQASAKSLSTKGKGRRYIFKKNPPLKAPTAVATVVTGDSVFHKSHYFQVGDIVSVMDHDGGIYYAQLKGFLSDQYNEKSAVITWLLPTANSPPNKFDPSTFILGPEEELPRKMEYMEFVCHAPSDYFKARGAPYKTINREPNLCYIWTSVGPQIQATPSIDEIFGISDGLSSESQVKERLKSSPAAKDRLEHKKRLRIDTGGDD